MTQAVGTRVAQNRPAVPVRIKRLLIEQVGGKCANPGCQNRALELHHIMEWAAYHTHDESHMIAVCPSCHDAVDRGSLTITDEELYAWKGIKREQASFVGSIFVEPAPTTTIPALRFGSINFTGPEGVTLFDFAGQKVALAVRDGELLVLNLKLSDASGRLVADVVDNYVRQRDPSINVEARTGRWRIRGPKSTFLPAWAVDCMQKARPLYGETGEIDLLDIQVVGPGQLSVSGAWVDDRRGVIAHGDETTLLTRKYGAAIGLVGPGATIFFFGDLDQSVFDTLVSSTFW
ncbi:HNH endonuclease signature motif containing protein [Streptomyces sp. NPDC047461]|uniref:HNH endonuclease signature motif containing protein n=1 Tax=Streptomyces sp. NPDC047461 TaxID=3155619 RepID=UPI0034046792